MIRIDNYKVFKDLTKDELFNEVLRRNKIDSNDVVDIKIVKKSIDARDKSNVHYNYAVNIKVKDDSKYPNIKKIEEKQLPTIKHNRNSKYQPIIIGAGPAGLFCALTLIDNGYKPIIIEQGSPVEDRISIVEEYKTKAMIASLDKLNANGKTLVVVTEDSVDERAWLSSWNIPNVLFVYSWEFNVYDVLNCETLIVTENALKDIEEVLING